MGNTIKIKVTTATIIDLMLAVDNRIKYNKENIKFNRNHKLVKHNDKYIKANKGLRKIYRALAGVKPILIEEVFGNEL